LKAGIKKKWCGNDVYWHDFPAVLFENLFESYMNQWEAFIPVLNQPMKITQVNYTTN
jgi:hypothetical protein